MLHQRTDQAPSALQSAGALALGGGLFVGGLYVVGALAARVPRPHARVQQLEAARVRLAVEQRALRPRRPHLGTDRFQTGKKANV